MDQGMYQGRRCQGVADVEMQHPHLASLPAVVKGAPVMLSRGRVWTASAEAAETHIGQVERR